VDGTHNQASLIEESVHLYVERGEECIRTQFHVTNLGRDQIILGYPWLEAFNPPIDWQNGKILGPQTKFKTTMAISREHEQEAYNIRRLYLEQQEQIRKVTIAQQMAEKYYEDHKEENPRDIPPEYQRHVQVFSEKEAECFPPSREWDHWIPLTPDAPETINIKMFSLAQESHDAIHNWVQKMLAKKFISRSDSQYGHATFTVPKKDRTYRIVQDFWPVNKYM
jgi:hypothetical protein